MDTSSNHVFRAGGPLGTADEAIYIQRQADSELLHALLKMEYIMVIEARQQGKTSLVMHTMHNFQKNNMVFVYVDASTLDNTTQEVWYAALCKRMSSQLEKIIADNPISLPRNNYQWRDYLGSLAQLAVKAGHKIVIVLDEIGSIHFPENELFFSVLREIYNFRELENRFRHLTFVLVGVFDPGELIKDNRVSPFNVASRIHLEDFTFDQVLQLTSLQWSGETAQQLAKRIYHWTDGQPYLTQALCKYLPADASLKDVDPCVERLCSEDSSHLPGLIQRLIGNQSLLNYVKETLAKQVRFNPELNRKHRELKLLGLVKGDKKGYLRIRNRIYSQILTQLEIQSENVEQSVTEHPVAKRADPSERVQQESGVGRSIFKSLIVALLIFTITIAILVWAARQVSVIALAIILVIGLVFVLLSTVTVFALNGVLPKKWTMSIYENILSKIPLLDFSKYFTNDKTKFD